MNVENFDAFGGLFLYSKRVLEVLTLLRRKSGEVALLAAEDELLVLLFVLLIDRPPRHGKLAFVHTGLLVWCQAEDVVVGHGSRLAPPLGRFALLRHVLEGQDFLGCGDLGLPGQGRGSLVLQCFAVFRCIRICFIIWCLFHLHVEAVFSISICFFFILCPVIKLANYLLVSFVLDPGLKVSYDILIVKAAQVCYLTTDPLIFLRIFIRQLDLLDSIDVAVKSVPRLVHNSEASTPNFLQFLKIIRVSRIQIHVVQNCVVAVCSFVPRRA